jgi:hypothetical protein
VVYDDAELRAMSPQERLDLQRALAALDQAGPGTTPVVRRRAVFLAFIVVCCVVLAAWIAVLALTLPRYYRAGGWRGAWVGFDIALLAAFVLTGWAAWRRRQLLIVCLIVLATLLCCDAWFDVVLDARTKGFELSLLSALFVELPIAALAIIGARRLLRASVAVIRHYEGMPGPLPRLRQIDLVGGIPGPHLADVFGNPESRAGHPKSCPPGPTQSQPGSPQPGQPGADQPGVPAPGTQRDYAPKPPP